MELTKDIEKLIEYIKRYNWWVQEEEVNEDYTILMIGKYSPAGQDFSITVEAEENSVDSFLYNLFEKYSDFDVSYEAYLWLDSSGHGKDGAPYDMKDLYEDMEWCQEEILNLWRFLDNIYR